MKREVIELLKEVKKSKGRSCRCIAYKLECDDCPFSKVDCTDRETIYNISLKLVKKN